jgi:hypothetical protein
MEDDITRGRCKTASSIHLQRQLVFEINYIFEESVDKWKYKKILAIAIKKIHIKMPTKLNGHILSQSKKIQVN